MAHCPAWDIVPESWNGIFRDFPKKNEKIMCVGQMGRGTVGQAAILLLELFPFATLRLCDFALRTLLQTLTTLNANIWTSLTNKLIAVLNDSKLPFESYSRAVLFSLEARLNFVEPDLHLPGVLPNWYYLRSRDNQFRVVHWGTQGDIPQAGDFDNNSNDPADFAVFRPSSGTWYILRSEGTQMQFTAFGLSDDIPNSSNTSLSN